VIEDLIEQTEAEQLLAPHHPALRAAIVDAWAKWHKNLAGNPDFANLSARSRACLVYDWMAESAEVHFDSIGITTSRKHGFLEVVFEDARTVLRFKKYKDAAFHTSGVPTSQRLEIEHQQVTLDGMTMTYLVAGYLPDDLGVGLAAIAISCTYNGSALWHLDLEDGIGADVTQYREEQPARPAIRSTRPAAAEGATEAH
jgi:hypothetical protein